MRTRFKRKFILLRLGLYLLGMASLSYFAYHTVTGNYGMTSGKAMQTQIDELNVESQVLAARRAYLAKQVKLMSDGTLEADMLDERARSLLAVSREDEIVIYQ